jgi:hypothetical protein
MERARINVLLRKKIKEERVEKKKKIEKEKDIIEIKEKIIPIKINFGKCSICQYNIKKNKNPYFITCGHCFHEECITPWLDTKIICPNCSCPTYIQDPDQYEYYNAYVKQQQEDPDNIKENIPTNDNALALAFVKSESLFPMEYVEYESISKIQAFRDEEELPFNGHHYVFSSDDDYNYDEIEANIIRTAISDAVDILYSTPLMPPNDFGDIGDIIYYRQTGFLQTLSNYQTEDDTIDTTDINQ